MFCKKCGAELAEGAVFCASCGNKQGDKNGPGVKPENKQPGKGFLKPVLIVCGAVVLLFLLLAVFSTFTSDGPSRGRDWTSPSTGMEFVWIPELDMWAGKYEVTNEEYRKKEPGHNSKDYKGHLLTGNRQPVVQVDFDDAKAYAEWMTRRDREVLPPGYGYRLPRVEEWMSFAQCGDGRLYPWGGAWPPAAGDAGNYMDISAGASLGKTAVPGYNDEHIVTAPVEKSWKNEWGLYGVGGNVWEACAGDSTGQTFGSWRGGSWWNNTEQQMRCSFSPADIEASARNSDCGFRLVLSEGGAPADYAPALTKTFSRRGYSFTIDYPGHWNEIIKDNIVILSGPGGSEEEFVTVTVQTLPSAETGGTYRNLEDVYSDLASSLNRMGGRIVEEKAAFNFPQNGQTLPGMGFGMEYEMRGTRYREMTCVIQSNSRFFFQISYAAPVELFEKYEGTGRAILGSLAIITEKTGAEDVLSALVSIDEECLRELKSKMEEWNVSVKRRDENTVWYDFAAPVKLKHADTNQMAEMAQLWPQLWAEELYPVPQTIRVSFHDASGGLFYAEYSHVTGKTVLNENFRETKGTDSMGFAELEAQLQRLGEQIQNIFEW